MYDPVATVFIYDGKAVCYEFLSRAFAFSREMQGEVKGSSSATGRKDRGAPAVAPNCTPAAGPSATPAVIASSGPQPAVRTKRTPSRAAQPDTRQPTPTPPSPEHTQPSSATFSETVLPGPETFELKPGTMVAVNGDQCTAVMPFWIAEVKEVLYDRNGKKTSVIICFTSLYKKCDGWEAPIVLNSILANFPKLKGRRLNANAKDSIRHGLSFI